MVTPSSLKTSALPESELTALLPCLATARRSSDARTKAVAVEILKEPVPEPPVPQVSMRGFLSTLTRFMRARIAVAAPAISSGTSPFILKATKNPAIWTWSTSPSMTLPMISCISV